MLMENDIVLYNLHRYGRDVNVVLKIICFEEHNHMKVTPINGWPVPFDLWADVVSLSQTYVVDTLYSMAPRTPSR